LVTTVLNHGTCNHTLAMRVVGAANVLVALVRRNARR